jgi:hypothetical protein
MAENSNQQQDSWTQGVSHFREAVEHNLTASRLMTTGALALGAAATAYFWDPERRNQFMEASRRLTGDMTNWWTNLASGSGQSGAGSGTANQ